MEDTLVLIKPEGVEKKLIGEIVNRFEKVDLQIVGMKLLQPTEEQADKHYVLSNEWVKGLADKTRASFAKKGIIVQETDMEIAKRVQGWLKTHLKSGQIVAMVIRGNQAIEIVRKIVGATEPKSAVPGTIRGDFSNDSYDLADKEKRCIRNIIHASSSTDEAKREIAVWFDAKTIYL